MLPGLSRDSPRYTGKRPEKNDYGLRTTAQVENNQDGHQSMITLREVTEEDFVPAAEFLSAGWPLKNTTPEMWLRRFEIWWNANPAYTDLFPKGWILENGPSIVGFIGNLPVRFLYRGEVKTAVAAVSWYVDPSVRGLSSLRLFHEFQKQKQASLFLFNSDNPDLMNIVIKNTYKEYIVPRFRKKYYFVTDRTKLDYIVKKYLFCGELPRLHELGVFIKKSGLLTCACLYQKPVRPSPGTDYTTSLCSSCDDAFSRIWESRQRACDVTLSRDTKTLNWIYFSSIYPGTRFVIQCRRSRDNSLAGYMVFDIQRKTLSDVGMMHLMDMCLETHDPQVLSSLLACAIDTARRHNAALLSVWGDNQETERYFRDTFALRMEVHQHNFIRISDIHDENLTVCPAMIAPPRGIDHT